MSTEALLLALSTVIRPTTVAALFAILSTRNPQRLLVAYLVAGAAFSLAVGTLVVVILQGLIAATSSSVPRPILDLILGGAALGYAAAAWAGWAPRRRSARENGAADADADAGTATTAGPAHWMQRRLKNLSVRGAALAGVLTHLPGLVYLAALNAIVGSATDAVDGLLQVLVYNAIWFSLPVLALLLSVRRPDTTRDLLERLRTWSRDNRRVVTVVFLGVLGAYLVVSGLNQLAGGSVP